MHALKTGKDYEILASFFLIAITEKVAIKNKGKMSHEGNSGIAAFVTESGDISRSSPFLG